MAASGLWQGGAHYEVLGLIGQGGMGSVYKARDRRLDRLVALKFLSGKLLESAEARASFHREAQAIASLSHPNIAVLYDVGEEAGQPFLALEYLGGGSLEQRGASRVLPVEEILEYARQLAAGLSHAHGHGIVHRDVKPSNALFAETGVLKLVDFGLAQWRGLVSVGDSPFGTPQYMAPEVLSGGEVDQRCDVFAFGVLLYRLAAGRLPFEGSRLEEVYRRISREPPEPLGKIRPDLPRAYITLVDQCLTKSAAQRPGSMALIRHELEMMEPAHRGSRGGRVSWDTPTEPMAGDRREEKRPGPRWRRTALWAAVATALIAAVVSLVLWRAGTGGLKGDRLVVVLPFVCPAVEAGGAGFCNGLHADLLPRLIQSRQFQKVFWTVSASELSSMGIRTAREAGSRLRADLALQGRVEVNRGEYQIQLDLTDARTSRLLQSRAITTSNTLSIPGALVEASLDLLSAPVNEAGVSELSAAPTTVPESYQLAVRAQGLLLEFEGVETIRRAAALLERAVVLDETNALAHALLSQAWQQEFTYGRDPALIARAAKEAERARELKPDDYQVLLTAGRALRWKGEFEGAASALNRAIETNPSDPEGYRLLGLVRQDEGKPEQALAALADAIRVNPNWWPTYQNRALLLDGKGRTEEAMRDLERALSLAPGHADILRDLGSYSVRLGRLDEAERYLRQSLSIRPTPRAYIGLSSVQNRQQRFPEAIHSLEEAAKLSPKNYLIQFNQAAIYHQMPGRQADMRAAALRCAGLLDELVAVSPANAKAWADLAICRARMGEIKSSMEASRRAVGLQPASPPVLRNAGIAAAIVGRREEAAVLLARAVEAGADTDGILSDTDLRALFQDAQMRRRIQTTTKRSNGKEEVK